MQIAATTVLRRIKRGWIVPSQTRPKVAYEVTSDHPQIASLDVLGGLTCTCPDFETRGQACKHIIAVELTVKRETAPDGSVTETVKVTYSQEWSSYNAAQCAEKDLFMPMLADLCSTIPNPPQGKGRPRLPRSDMAFAAVSRIYSGLSARRADSDVREAKDKGLTDCDPHFNSVLRYLRDPEMTPSSAAWSNCLRCPSRQLRPTSPLTPPGSLPAGSFAGSITNGARSRSSASGSSFTPCAESAPTLLLLSR
jgi:hypothetical protein